MGKGALHNLSYGDWVMRLAAHRRIHSVAALADAIGEPAIIVDQLRRLQFSSRQISGPLGLKLCRVLSTDLLMLREQWIATYPESVPVLRPPIEQSEIDDSESKAAILAADREASAPGPTRCNATAENVHEAKERPRKATEKHRPARA